MINMHASGGLEMMQAAREAANEKAAELGISKPILLGVTVLTSINEGTFQQNFGSQRRLMDQVAYLAELSRDAGLFGVVASAQEIKVIRQVCGDDFVIVTPGIRPRWAATDDQQRIMTPGEAIAAGADYIVVGRPITTALDPVRAVERVLQEMKDSGARREKVVPVGHLSLR
jgi:orotidine-5'-phosphate decarboxylase